MRTIRHASHLTPVAMAAAAVTLLASTLTATAGAAAADHPTPSRATAVRHAEAALIGHAAGPVSPAPRTRSCAT